MRRSFLLWIAGGVCAGIVISEYIQFPLILLGGVFVVGLALASSRQRLLGVGLMAVIIGCIRMTVATADHAWPSNLSTAQWTGIIMERPSVYFGQMTMVVGDVLVDQQRWPGQMELRVSDQTQFFIGQTVGWQGTPEQFSGSTYWRQRAHGIRGWFAVDAMNHPAKQRSTWRRSLALFQDRLRQGIEQHLRSTPASFVVGVLFGAQTDMPKELREQFQRTGTTHMVALSGFNVTIIISLVMAWCRKTLGRSLAVWPSLGFVVLFVIMTGASASVTRAAVMATIVQLGLLIGRPIAPWRLLTYAGLMMVLHNPLVLKHDLGFQLSFLATVGLVWLAEPVSQRLLFIPDRYGLRSNMSATLAAMMATEPLLLSIFGRLSIIAPIVNTLVLPLIPMAMAGGALLALSNLVVPQIAMQIAQPVDALVRLILSIIAWGASLPWAAISMTGWLITIVSFIFTVSAILFLRNGQKISS